MDFARFQAVCALIGVSLVVWAVVGTVRDISTRRESTEQLTRILENARSSVPEDSMIDQSRFHSEADYVRNRANQIAMAPDTVRQLREYGVTEESKLRLEYFFYTNAPKKAEALADQLAARGYDGKHEVAAGDTDQYVVTGWTDLMFMSDSVVASWVSEMCDLGFRHDCEFDGWGTNPSQ